MMPRVLQDSRDLGKAKLAVGREAKEMRRMWNEPYLESCCRSALHRLMLSGAPGRPDGLKDGRCLERLETLGLAQQRADHRFTATEAGRLRHADEVLHRPVQPSGAS
jgi:hypothetical protein